MAATFMISHLYTCTCLCVCYALFIRTEDAVESDSAHGTLRHCKGKVFSFYARYNHFAFYQISLMTLQNVQVI